MAVPSLNCLKVSRYLLKSVSESVKSNFRIRHYSVCYFNKQNHPVCLKLKPQQLSRFEFSKYKNKMIKVIENL